MTSGSGGAGPDEAECQIQCGDKFSNAVVDDFTKCAVSAKSCVPQRQDDGSYPVPKDEVLVSKFSTEALEGPAPAVTLRLEDSEATRKVWPFRFALSLRVELFEEALTMTLRCENRGRAGGAPAAARDPPSAGGSIQ